MKNFKKLIASLLAVIIAATSVLTVSAASVDYSDGYDITRVEAVDIMSAIDVIHGNPDGSFNPDGDVTRAEMAKMVTFILNEGEDVNDDYESANSFTDCGWHWAKGYIAFAANENIVDGNGDGTFTPDGSVTGAEAAKMLLTSLGYSSATEGYTGSNWMANVISDARKAGLVDDFPKGFVYTTPLSRELAAQMMFNALKATMVDYTGAGSTVTLPDGTVINSGNATIYNRTWTGTAGTNYETGKNSAADETIELCEEYFPDLYISTSSSDSYDLLGRPSQTWYFEKTAVGTYSTDADYSFFSEEEVTTADDFNEAVEDAANVDLTSAIEAAQVYVNGEVQESFGEGAAELQRGDIVELFMDEDDSKLVDRITITRYVYDTVKYVYDEADIDDSEIVTDGGETLTNDDTLNFAALLAGAVEGEAILIAGNAAAEYPTTVTGDITRYTNGESIIMDGTTYYITTDSYANNTMGITDGDSESTIYLASSGFVVYAEDVDSDNSGDMVAVIDSYTALDSGNKIVNMVDAVTASGTIVSLQVDKAYDEGKAYTYTEDDDVYTLSDPADLADFTEADGKSTGFASMTVSTGTFSIPLNIGDGTENVYFSDDVNFIFMDTADDNETTVYKGITAFDSAQSGYAVLEQVNKGGTTRSDYLISAMFIIGDNAVADDAESSSDDIFFIDGTKTGTNRVNGTTYHTYDVYVNGKAVTDIYATSENYTGGFYTAKVNEDGAHTFTSFTEDSDYTAVTGKYADCINDRYLTIEGSDYDFDISGARIVNTTDGDYDKLRDFDTDANLTFFYDEDFMVEAIYVID